MYGSGLPILRSLFLQANGFNIYLLREIFSRSYDVGVSSCGLLQRADHVYSPSVENVLWDLHRVKFAFFGMRLRVGPGAPADSENKNLINYGWQQKTEISNLLQMRSQSKYNNTLQRRTYKTYLPGLGWKVNQWGRHASRTSRNKFKCH